MLIGFELYPRWVPLPLSRLPRRLLPDVTKNVLNALTLGKRFFADVEPCNVRYKFVVKMS